MLIRSALYITTHITGTFRYFSWCAHPNIWYARIQKKIIDFGLREGNTINFSTKFYPNDFLNNPNKEYIQSLKQDAILSEPLVGILTKYDFDLIITEAAATTLLEILCTKSQVLLYVPPDFIKLEKEAISLLSERVFIAEREAHYLELAETLLCGKNTLDPKPINDDFLFKYGMGAPSQDPKALAITNLNKIMNEIQL